MMASEDFTAGYFYTERSQSFGSYTGYDLDDHITH